MYGVDAAANTEAPATDIRREASNAKNRRRSQILRKIITFQNPVMLDADHSATKFPAREIRLRGPPPGKAGFLQSAH
jgi:hypothetical protein